MKQEPPQEVALTAEQWQVLLVEVEEARVFREIVRIRFEEVAQLVLALRVDVWEVRDMVKDFIEAQRYDVKGKR